MLTKFTAECFIGVGSNIAWLGEDRTSSIKEAVARLAAIDGLEVIRQSSVYQSQPVGFACSDWFRNSVVKVETTINPARLLSKLKNIEAMMGRRGSRRKKYESRVIDLDILLYGGLIVDEMFLSIPHPHMHERRFVMVPMEEVAPDLVHPLLRMSMRDILDDLEDCHLVRGSCV
ncbi:MAG: 2-amino-4-hydroxy-6-hydroxymethyldihydropteridine diphosphokinase [Deltaproteobacteria bacterium]|nr:2-amino-4-hydroxy-6-hydroxymethyldihydropteridine diphosphokinase [Deltaproteobacteria bacterium]